MSRSWRESDGPTLLALMTLGLLMGILIALMLLDRNKDLLDSLFLTGGALVVLCGGFSMSARGPIRAVLMVFAAIGAGMLAAVVTAMQ